MTSPTTGTGVYPGWRIEKFDELFQRISTRGHKILASAYARSGTVPVVDQGQELVAGFTDQVGLALDPGDEGVVIFGDHTCHTKFVATKFVVGADGTQILRAVEGNSAKFLAYWLELNPVSSDGYNRHFGRLREKLFLVPPLREQRRIAEALNDADDLISALERLIVKKEAIRQGMMQELLSGRTRLPGFGGEWNGVEWSSLVVSRQGNGQIKGRLSDRRSDEAPYQGFSASGPDVWLPAYDYAVDGMVVSAVGSRCGKTFLAQGEWSAIANTHVLLPRAEALDAGFAVLHLNDERFWIKGGSGQPFVQIRASLSQTVELPPLEEQRAIASVLSDADDELEALRKRLEKAKAVKQGMMQELLTGRTRLPIEPEQEVEAA